MKRFYILEKNTGLVDGTYPEDIANAELNGAKTLYPNGDFVLMEAKEDFPDDCFYSGMKDFEKIIENCKLRKREENSRLIF